MDFFKSNNNENIDNEQDEFIKKIESKIYNDLIKDFSKNAEKLNIIINDKFKKSLKYHIENAESIIINRYNPFVSSLNEVFPGFIINVESPKRKVYFSFVNIVSSSIIYFIIGNIFGNSSVQWKINHKIDKSESKNYNYIYDLVNLYFESGGIIEIDYNRKSSEASILFIEVIDCLVNWYIDKKNKFYDEDNDIDEEGDEGEEDEEDEEDDDEKEDEKEKKDEDEDKQREKRKEKGKEQKNADNKHDNVSDIEASDLENEKKKKRKKKKINYNIGDFIDMVKSAFNNQKNNIINLNPESPIISSIELSKNINWDEVSYSNNSIDNIPCVTNLPLGIYFCGNANFRLLIRCSVELTRLTNNNAVSILGGLTSALFMSYAIRRIPIENWPNLLLVNLTSKYIKTYLMYTRPKEYNLFKRDKILFLNKWKDYITKRFISSNKPNFEKHNFNLTERYKWLTDNFSKNSKVPGENVDDCMILVYDSLLSCRKNFETLIVYSSLHPGSADVIGAISLSLYCCLYCKNDYNNFLLKNYQLLEYKKKLTELLKKSQKYFFGIFGRDIFWYQVVNLVLNTEKV